MATYNRDAISTAMRSLLATILQMGNRLPAALHLPPLNGWDFGNEKLSVLAAHKTPAVVDLMRRLPYADTYVAGETKLIDYRVGGGDYGVEFAWDPIPFRNGGPVVDAAELPLTFQWDGMGTILVLDVRTGELLFFCFFSPSSVGELWRMDFIFRSRLRGVIGLSGSQAWCVWLQIR